MRHSKVGTVMTSDVVQVRSGTPFKEVARLLARYRVSGLPVVDDDEKVIGVISEADIVQRQAQQQPDEGRRRRPRPPRLTRAARAAAAKARGSTAGQLMSAPAITAHANDSIAEAARIMGEHRIKRLPVVDEEERLVGIVTRHDLLQMFLRPDDDIRAEVVDEVLVRTLWLTPQIITVSVRGGVVELAGKLERRSEVPIALRLASQVDGVVAVVDHLTYERDDSRLEPLEPSVRGITEDWIRRL